MPNTFGDLVLRRRVIRLRNGGFKHGGECACFILKNVQKLLNVQSRFFFKFPSSSPSDSLAEFYLTARRSPFRLQFANEQYMPVFFAK